MLLAFFCSPLNQLEISLYEGGTEFLCWLCLVQVAGYAGIEPSTWTVDYVFIMSYAKIKLNLNVLEFFTTFVCFLHANE